MPPWKNPQSDEERTDIELAQYRLFLGDIGSAKEQIIQLRSTEVDEKLLRAIGETLTMLQEELFPPMYFELAPPLSGEIKSKIFRRHLLIGKRVVGPALRRHIARLAYWLETRFPTGEFLGITVDKNAESVTRKMPDGVSYSVRFSNKNRPRQLFLALYSAGAAGMSRQKLVELIWGNQRVEPNNLDQQKTALNLIIQQLMLQAVAEDGVWRLESIDMKSSTTT